MAELSALNVRITGDAADLRAAAVGAVADIQKIGTAATVAQTKATAMGGALGRLSSMSGQARSQIQNLGYQVSDAAVQFGMGTRATTIFAQQGSQILGTFGPVGAVLGALATITLPLLGAAFASSGEKALTVAEAVDNLSDRLSDLNDAVSVYSAEGVQSLIDKYGELNEGVLLLIERQRQFAEVAAMEAAREVAQLMLADYGSLLNQVSLAEDASADLTNQLGLTSQEAYNLRTALQQLRDAKSFEEQAAALSVVNGLLAKSKISTGEVAGAALEAESAMRQLAAAAPQASWMSAAIAGVASLGATIRERIAEALALRATMEQAARFTPQQIRDQKGNVYSGRGGDPRAITSGSNTFGGSTYTPPRVSGGGGGGGGGVDPMVAEVDRLREQLMSKEQLEMESYAKQQEMLLQAYDQKLVTQEEYNLMLQNAELQHANEMAMIKEAEAEMVRNAARGMYGELEGLLSSFGSKSKAAAIAAIALNKGLRIAEIVQNTAAAQMRAYAELGPISGAAAAAKIGLYGKVQAGIVAAAGLAQAGGVAGGGGGGAGSSSAAGGGTTETRTANINFYGGFQPTQESIDMIASGLNDWLGDGGRLNVGGAS